MENYSLSDIKSMMDGGSGVGSSSLILIILFLLIFGGGAFGGRNNVNEYATAASQQEILFGQRFSNLDNKMDKLGNGIADATFALNNAITTEGRNIQTQLCAINSNIDNKFAALEKSQLEQRIAEQAAQINQLQMAQAMCGVPKISTNAWGIYPYNAQPACCGTSSY